MFLVLVASFALFFCLFVVCDEEFHDLVKVVEYESEWFFFFGFVFLAFFLLGVLLLLGLVWDDDELEPGGLYLVAQLEQLVVVRRALDALQLALRRAALGGQLPPGLREPELVLLRIQLEVVQTVQLHVKVEQKQVGALAVPDAVAK